jgi:hypothetical protein
MNVHYPRRFFEINLLFAQRIAEVSTQAFDEALLDYTILYTRLGLGRDFDPMNPTWREYLGGLRRAQDMTEWTYRFYLARPAQPDLPARQPDFGCFSYEVWPGNRLRLHFHNAETSDYGPLSRHRIDVRLSELRRMLGYVRRCIENPTTVVGGSWLYNIEAYRRLFPPAFLATARDSYVDYPFLVLWGQFLDRNGQIKEDLAGQFLGCLKAQCDLEGVKRCFPYPVQRLECPVQHFYEFYRV